MAEPKCPEGRLFKECPQVTVSLAWPWGGGGSRASTDDIGTLVV